LALDPSLRLLKYGLGELVTRGTYMARETDYMGNPPDLVLVSVGKAEPIMRFHEGDYCSADPYVVLERLGIVALGYDQLNEELTGLRLAGGSVCETRLKWSDQGWMVVKTSGLSGLAAVDTYERHEREARWLSLPLHDARRRGRCFPKICSSKIGDGKVSFTSEFLPRYTLGERILQGRETEATLKVHLQQVFATLNEHLYCFGNTRQQVSYMDVVARRINMLRRVDSYYEDVWSRGLIVNDTTVPSLKEMFRRIEEYDLDAIRAPRGGWECHGDLILEDILPPSLCSPGEMAFVDPNPMNCSPIIDVAKLLMNLGTLYDLAYRDRFMFHASWNPAGTLEVRFEFYDREIVSLFDRIGGYLLDSIHEFLPVHLTKWAAIDPLSAKVQAGLHALALPAFHDVHHGAKNS
jgi:hypothetical protein